ncbi:MAG: alpha-amylase family glycosyl hydrolase [Ignavibacteriaceae bacterium]|jgi:glycosidase|nr:alpha-amylase family glycosyl hydrolase [Ignavibacteriaceae bacterium]
MVKEKLSIYHLKFHKLTLLIISFLVLVSFNSFSQSHHDWSYNRCIYEVNVRQYTQSGTFAEFATHLDRLKDMGIGILWFMPIHPIGIVNRLGTLGSYYSVKDYYEVNSEFGTLEEFKELVDSIHARGMYVMMDWVGNHTSWDNNLTVTHPEWYITDAQGNFVPPPGTNWSDVIQLDYSQQELRDYMIDAMKFWINEADIDGFRCDAVSFMPIDFWAEAITELKTIKPEILMLAEDDATQYQAAGFDMTYGWGYHGFGSGILNKIVAGTNNANNLRSYVNSENTFFSLSHYRMYFTSNHDENSWYGTVFEQLGDATEEFLVLTSTFRSMPLIYSGQEAGLDHRLLFFDKDEIIWQPHPFANIYLALFNLKKVNKALWNGDRGGQLQRILTTNNPAIFAFFREKEEDRVFEVFNLTNSEQTFTLLDSLYSGKYRNAFANDSIYFSGNTVMTLPAWGYKVYEYGSGITSVINEIETLDNFILYQNYPNPFNPQTKIRFSILQSGNVLIKVFNVLGKEIETIVDEYKNSGFYELYFNANNLPSGVYFYRIVSGSYSDTKKMILLR